MTTGAALSNLLESARGEVGIERIDFDCHGDDDIAPSPLRTPLMIADSPNIPLRESQSSVKNQLREYEADINVGGIGRSRGRKAPFSLDRVRGMYDEPGQKRIIVLTAGTISQFHMIVLWFSDYDDDLDDEDSTSDALVAAGATVKQTSLSSTVRKNGTVFFEPRFV